jgi:hypothetical protein
VKTKKHSEYNQLLVATDQGLDKRKVFPRHGGASFYSVSG